MVRKTLMLVFIIEVYMCRTSYILEIRKLKLRISDLNKVTQLVITELHNLLRFPSFLANVLFCSGPHDFSIHVSLGGSWL